MLRALKVVMVVYGAILVVGGLANILIPDRMAELGGVGEMSGYAKGLMAYLGAIRVAAGVWVIVAGRDPVSRSSWVKFAILELILFVVVGSYSIIQGYVDFTQGGGPLLIVAAIFAVVLVALNRRVAASAMEQVPAG